MHNWWVWKSVYWIGLLGFGLVVVATLLSVGSYAVDASDGILSEGSGITKAIRVLGFRAFVAAGFILLIPDFVNLARSHGRISSSSRIAWTIVMLMFSFVATYLYFGLHILRREARLHN